MSKEKINKPRHKAQPSLENLLAPFPQLEAKLIEALQVGRFFITLTCQKKSSPDDSNDLKHFWMRQRFSIADAAGSLDHITNDFKAKEMPTSEIKSDDWH